MLEHRREFIINSLYYLIIVGIVYLAFRFTLYAVMPFVFGFAAAAVVNPTVRFLARRFDMKRKPAGIMLLLLFYATIGMLATVLAVRAAVSLGELMTALPRIYSEKLEPLINRLFELINALSDKISGIFGSNGLLSSAELGDFFGQIKASLGSAVSELSVVALTKLSGFAATVPRVVVNVGFAVLSSFFFTVEYENILAFLKKALPKRVVGLLSRIRGRSFKAVCRYIRSYLIIMLITFAELSLGLTLLGIKPPFAAALGISLFDILPVFGTGGILVPWAAIRLLSGDYGFSVGLLLLWAVISVIRNIIEPKIVGKQVGLHPLATLIAMFVGTKLFGIIGLFLLPLSLAVLLPLRDESRDS